MAALQQPQSAAQAGANERANLSMDRQAELSLPDRLPDADRARFPIPRQHDLLQLQRPLDHLDGERRNFLLRRNRSSAGTTRSADSRSAASSSVIVPQAPAVEKKNWNGRALSRGAM